MSVMTFFVAAGTGLTTLGDERHPRRWPSASTGNPGARPRVEPSSNRTDVHPKGDSSTPPQ